MSHPHLVPTYHLAAPGLYPRAADRKGAEINWIEVELILNVLVGGAHAVITILVSTIINNCLLTDQQN